MRLPLDKTQGAPVSKEIRTAEAKQRARRIAGRLAERTDLRIRDRILSFGEELDYRDREWLLIEQTAWEHIREIGLEPHLVFAHPRIMEEIPQASLHYRGIALLSRKRVAEIAGSIDRWESTPARARVTSDKALRISRLYNAVISSIIIDNTDWTIENGYRNILATMGITEDGAMRNLIGQEAEKAIKERLLDWVFANNLTAEPNPGKEGSQWDLKEGILMQFGSEPDISFIKNGKYVTLIEIKGGKDPAGALERLGAIQKTFAEAPVTCKNFLVLGTETDTMRKRLDELGLEGRSFIDDLLFDDGIWEEFMNEIFHHALRII